MLGADLTPFFNTGEFAVAASWTPSGGGSTVSEKVILESADVDVLSGRQVSTDWRITFPTSSALAALDEGEVVTVDGAAYEVREARRIDDGLLMAATLTAL